MLGSARGEEAADLASVAIGAVVEGIKGDDLSVVAGYFRCFHLILSTIKGAEARAVIKRAAPAVFNRALDLLSSTATAEQTSAALFLLTSLAGKKDVLLLPPRSISLILALSSLRLPSSPSLFAPLAGLIESLLRHYPKSVYGCLPSLVATLLTMLSSLLEHPEAAGVVLRCVQLSRVLESLGNHKDAFKKHTTGLLLCLFSPPPSSLHPPPSVRLALRPGTLTLLSLAGPAERGAVDRGLEGGERNAYREMVKASGEGKFKGN